MGLNIKVRLKNFITRNYMLLYSAFHPVEKKVLFDSFGGKQYSDNPRAISESLHSLYPDYKISWLYSGEDHFHMIPDYVKVVSPGLQFYRELATSFCFVTNSGITTAIRKRHGQYFIQTWHGDRPIKKILYDIEQDEKLLIIDDKLTDLCIAGSQAGIKQYRSAFRYKGEILSVGMPRNDVLVNISEQKQKDIKARLGIAESKNVLLYAPTFRDNNTKNQAINVDLHTVMDILEREGEQWVCLIRAHSSASGLKYDYDGEKFIDANGFPDMADLLSFTDILITDYSSCAGDLVTRNAMVILAVFDKEDYENNCRELVFDLEDTGFYIAKNQDELNTYITKRNDKMIEENCKKINAFYGAIESGDSSNEVCRRIDAEYKKDV